MPNDTEHSDHHFNSKLKSDLKTNTSLNLTPFRWHSARCHSAERHFTECRRVAKASSTFAAESTAGAINWISINHQKPCPVYLCKRFVVLGDVFTRDLSSRRKRTRLKQWLYIVLGTLGNGTHRGARKLMRDNLKVVLAESSTLS